MSVWASLANLFRRPVNIWYEQNEAATLQVLGQAPSELYRTQPHLQTVVSFLARNVAQLGLQMFDRVSDTDRPRVTDDPAILLLRHPNSSMTGYELLHTLVADLALYDTAYWLVLPDAASPSGWGIRPIPPEWVSSTKGGSLFEPELYVVTPPAGERVEILAADMLVFHGWNPSDPRTGTPPVAALKDVLAEQIDAWRFRRQLWQRGGRIGAVLLRPKDAPRWDQSERERFARDWREFQNGGAKAGSTPLLEDGITMQRVGFSAREEEWAEATKLSLQTVASIYHVNPVMVGILDNANFSNTREFRKMLYSETLGPLLRMIEDRLNTFLLPRVSQREGAYLEFNIASKLAGDFEEQASVLSTSTGAPWVTVNEARARQNLPAIDGGDELIVPLNVIKGGQSSPQDGGEPSAAVEEVVKAWLARRERAALSAAGSGGEIDEGRFQRELQADLTLAGMDQFAAGVASLRVSEQMRSTA